MDKEREIRFLYPAMIVGLYFAWGWLGDPQGWRELDTIKAVFKNMGPVPSTLAGILAGGSLILIIGYVLGTVTYTALRGLSWLCSDSTHEIPNSPKALEAIWSVAGLESKPLNNAEQQMATVWLDFSQCKQGVHEWIVRRWNAFNLSANIASGLLICLAWRVFHSSRQTPACWCIFGLIGFVICFANALIAHRDTMAMLEFAAKRARLEQQRKEANSVAKPNSP